MTTTDIYAIMAECDRRRGAEPLRGITEHAIRDADDWRDQWRASTRGDYAPPRVIPLGEWFASVRPQV